MTTIFLDFTPWGLFYLFIRSLIRWVEFTEKWKPPRLMNSVFIVLLVYSFLITGMYRPALHWVLFSLIFIDFLALLFVLVIDFKKWFSSKQAELEAF